MRMGTRTLYLSADVVIKDHPHAYGDKYNVGGTTPSKKGSSPRVWGQASNAGASSVKIRIIPTRMGTRRLRESVLNCKPDHPHAYGDKLYQLPFNVFGKGSSPRVWGQVRLHKVSCFLLWIIPTRMGTSKFKITKKTG